MSANETGVGQAIFTCPHTGMALCLTGDGRLLFSPSPGDAFQTLAAMVLPAEAKRVVFARNYAHQKLVEDARPPVTGLPKTDATIAAAFAGDVGSFAGINRGGW